MKMDTAKETPINKATASELGRLGNKIRWDAWRAKKIAEETQDNAVAMAVTEQEGIPEPEFRERAKLRARGHLEKLQSRIDDLLDRKDLDVRAMRDLADAVLKLESVEQRLSGRPLPGTLRPVSKRPSKTQAGAFEPEA